MRQILVIYIIFLVKSFVEGEEIEIRNETTWEVKSILEGRIVNGHEAYLGQFPHQVSLRRIWIQRHFCGGSIINRKWILTAAHCMYQGEKRIQPFSFTVVAGNLLLQGSSKTEQERLVEKFIEHKQYNNFTLDNDLALVLLKEPFVENEATKVAKMPTGPTKPGTKCLVAGWGYLSSSVKVASNELMFVDLPIISKEECKRQAKGKYEIPNGVLCAGYEKGGKDSCQGDSGGGMMCGDFLTGVVSGGDGCAKPESPGLYSDVYFHKSWIDSSIVDPKTIKNFRNNCGSPDTSKIFWLVFLAIFGFFFS